MRKPKTLKQLLDRLVEIEGDEEAAQVSQGLWYNAFEEATKVWDPSDPIVYDRKSVERYRCLLAEYLENE